jgi:hypothetical protein
VQSVFMETVLRTHGAFDPMKPKIIGVGDRVLAMATSGVGTNVQGVYVGPRTFSTLNGPVQVEYPRVYAQTCPQ